MCWVFFIIFQYISSPVVNEKKVEMFTSKYCKTKNLSSEYFNSKTALRLQLFVDENLERCLLNHDFIFNDAIEKSNVYNFVTKLSKTKLAFYSQLNFFLKVNTMVIFY